MYGNVRSVVQNYAALGIDRFLLARAIESLAELETCRNAVSAQEVTVCRVLARIETMEQRVRNRETGPRREEYVARVSKLNTILDGAAIESFSVTNEDRPQAHSAREMLIKAGWISG